jgi:excisionase family DNA binding protein
MLDVNPNGVYTIEEVAEGLGVCKGTVYNMVNQDGLKSSRIRGNTYVRGTDLMNFLFPVQDSPKLRLAE